MRRLAIAGVASLLTVAASAPARADTVTDWHSAALGALSAPAPLGAGQPPHVTTIHMAIVHGAVYGAVNVGDWRHPHYSKDTAAATAAYRVLVSLVPAQQDRLASLYEDSLENVRPGRAKSRGVAVGEKVAAAVLAARANDGRFGAFRFTAGSDPGEWQPVLPAFGNDPNAWVADVTPFLIRRASDFRTHGPDRLSSRRYAKEFEEVKTLGALDSEERTQDQTDMARFWAEGPSIWSRVALQLSARYRLRLTENARLYAMVYLAGADALIACWDDKARWSFWRPITAIRGAGSDGNPATSPDPDWLPLINTPPYPDHPSGLASVIAAMAEASRDFFGTDRVAFSATSSAITRRFSRFSDAVDDVVDARVYSGIHFRTADEDGARMGTQVARAGLARLRR
jgi:hypothetical protein